nr:hypothetical protein [Mycoplasmopsis bovis]
MSEKVEIKEETKKPTLIYYELVKPEPIAEPACCCCWRKDWSCASSIWACWS